MTSGRPFRRVVIVGAGAAGTMVAIQLCEAAARHRSSFELVLVDPAPEAGPGIAYSTTDSRHRLNVPAGNMSCYPEDLGHFVRWLSRHGEPQVTAADFATRHRYGTYLADIFRRAVVAVRGTVNVRRLRTRVTRCGWTGSVTGGAADNGRGAARLKLADGTALLADGVVLATGPAQPDAAWVPEALASDERFVAGPWTPGALEPALAEGCTDDILLVGAGLTAMDLAMTLNRRGRTVHAVSRSGRLPQAHATASLPPAAFDEPLEDTSLSAIRAAVHRHIGRTVRTVGDWRPAIDGLRPITAELWALLSAEERAAFVTHDASLWNTHRHRMSPITAESVARMARAGRLRTHRGRVAGAEMLPDGRTAVTLTDGRTRRELKVGWVVDCTGPGRELSDPLWQSLFADGTAVPDPLRMGVVTDNGRLRDACGSAARPMWTLGTLRRGELWESTAIPEIRSQAAAVAEAVFSSITSDGAPAPSDSRRVQLATGEARFD